MAKHRSVIEVLLTAKNRAGADLKKFQGQITAVATAYVAMRQGIQDVGAALDAIVGKTIANARQYKAFSERIGISAEVLSQLTFAAKQNNVSFEQLSMGLQRMTRRLGEISKLGTGEAKPALEALNLPIKELLGLAPERQYLIIADALHKVSDDGERAALAMKFFDSEGVALLQTMGEGAEGLRRWMQEAVDVGAAMDDALIEKADKAARQMARVKGAIDGVTNAITEGLLDALTDSDIDRLTELFKSMAGVAGKTTTIIVDAVGFLRPFSGADMARDARLRRERVRELGADQVENPRLWKRDIDLLSGGRAGSTDFIKPITDYKEIVEEIEGGYQRVGEQIAMIHETTGTVELANSKWLNVVNAIDERMEAIRFDQEQLGANLVHIWVDFADAAAFAFARSFVEGENFFKGMKRLLKDMVTQVIYELVRIAFVKWALGLAASFIPGLNVAAPVAGNYLPGIGGAGGGPVNARQPSIGPRPALAPGGGGGATLNITVNAGFSSRGEGLAAARVIAGYLRQAGY